VLRAQSNREPIGCVERLGSFEADHVEGVRKVRAIEAVLRVVGLGQGILRSSLALSACSTRYMYGGMDGAR
jgi:hypothetical protein